MSSPEPLPGQLWRITGPAEYGIYLTDGFWSILVARDGEYALTDTRTPVPVEIAAIQPKGLSWSEQFDALASVSGLATNWAREVARYRAQGLARARLVDG